MRALFACLAISLLALSPVAADAPSAAALLRDAEDTFANVDFARTAELAQAAISAGGLATVDLARAYDLIATSRASLAEPAAVDAYIKLLAIAQDARPSELLSPERRTAYDDARAYWAMRNDERLRIDVSYRSPSAALALRVHDPLALAAWIEVELLASSQAPPTRLEVTQSEMLVPVSVSSPELRCVIRLLDGHENVLLSLGAKEAPFVLATGVPQASTVAEPTTPVLPAAPAPQQHEERPRRSFRPWLWGALGVVLAAGAVTMLVVARSSEERVNVASDVAIKRQ